MTLPESLGDDRGTRGEELLAGLPESLERLVGTVIDHASLPRATSAEVEAELRSHFEEGLAAGRTAKELSEAFGDPEQVARWILRTRRDRPLARDWIHPGGVRARWSRRVGWVGLGRELLQTFRGLRRSPGFTLAAVLTLAVGIGANTAVFSVLDAVLLSPLPYPEPDRLVRVYELEASTGGPNYLRAPAIIAWRDWDDIFADFGTLYTYNEVGADLTGGDRPQRVTISTVDSGFFSTLGASPFLGRMFERSDETLAPVETGSVRAGSPRVILSEGMWRTVWAGDPGIVGRTIQLDGISFEVVGVLEAEFESPFGGQPDIWVPQDMSIDSRWNGWDNFYLSAVARLPGDLSLEQAQAALRARHQELAAESGYTGEQWDRWIPGIEPLKSDLVGQTRSALLWFLSAAVGLVLLSACVNVANLFLVRSLGRSQELAVRASLGSTRSRLVVQLLGEAAIVAGLGGTLGLALGWLGVDLLVGSAPEALPSFSDPGLNMRVVLFAGAAVVTTALLFGLIPAIKLSQRGDSLALRDGHRRTEGLGVTRFRDVLVIGEVAVALTLVIGATLLARSFSELQQAQLGVEPARVLTFEVHLPDARYPSGESREALHSALQVEIESIPEIVSAGAVSWLPVNGAFNSWGFSWTDQALFPWEDGGDGDSGEVESLQTNVRIFRGDFFGTMGIDLLLGDPPDPNMADGERTVWISRELVRQIFEPVGVEPIGASVWVANERRTVAGVVEDLPLDVRGTLAPQTFIPHAHYASNRNWALIQTAKIRAGADFTTTAELLREAVRRVDADLVLFRPRPFESVLAEGIARDRFAALLMSFLAALALILAAIGTYGVLAYSVGLRKREIGIRMALGATVASVQSLVVGHGLKLVGLGLLLGVCGAWGAGRWIESLLFGVDAADPVAWLAGPIALLAAGALAGWIPTMRAAEIDPARTLASE